MIHMYMNYSSSYLPLFLITIQQFLQPVLVNYYWSKFIFIYMFVVLNKNWKMYLFKPSFADLWLEDCINIGLRKNILVSNYNTTSLHLVDEIHSLSSTFCIRFVIVLQITEYGTRTCRKRKRKRKRQFYWKYISWEW